MARTFRVLLTAEEENGFSVSIPSLHGCFTQGETIKESMGMARKTISLYVESLKAERESVPDDSKSLEYSLTHA